MNTQAVVSSENRSAELALLVERLSARLEAGEPVDREEVEQQHPEFAAELRELLPAMALLVNLSRSAERRGVSPMSDDGAPLGELGDYRIVREVGRGGMGIVYEAEQISLGRRVALKMLPYAATMDPKHLQRFKNEAKAAASLRHEHIVHVYGVGCERGVHYYAMEFIEGQTLADLIAGMHADHPASRECERRENATVDYSPVAHAPGSPIANTAPVAALSTERSGPKNREFYRTAAGLIADAADALEHAHGLGIVHRDVKPGNLLVDAAGKLYVSDFGLARVGPDAGLTVSGDLLGTLRYMAPEQAMSRHGLVDHRADIYGLGATLYELLTGQPAVDAAERAEILRQIAFEEPAAPRKLDKAISAELETITLKCLAKNPNERYATSGDLAADLRRWLDNQTIKARRPSVRQRLDKWTRRHSVTVMATVVALLVGMAVSTWRAAQANLARRRADEQRERAQANLRTAQDAIEQMLTRLGEQRLRGIPQMEKLRAEVLQDALKLQQRLLEEQSTDIAARANAARAHAFVGVIQSQLGNHTDAVAAYRQAIRMLRELTATVPTEPDFRHRWAGCVNDLALSLEAAGQVVEALQAFEEARDLQEKLVSDYPDVPTYREFLANMHNNLGALFSRSNRLGEAERALRRALDIRMRLVQECPDPQGRYSKMLANAHSNLTSVLNRQGRPIEAERAARKALALQEELLARFPGDPELSWCTAHTLKELGTVLDDLGRFHDGEEAYRRAIPIQQKLAAEFPSTPDYRDLLARLHGNLGTLMEHMNRHAEAEKAHRQAIAMAESLAGEFPNLPKHRYHLALLHQNLGILLKQIGRVADAEQAYRQALTLLDQLNAASPGQPDYRHSRANIRHNWGGVLKTTGQLDLAEEMYQQCLTERERLSTDFPDDLEYLIWLAHSRSELGDVFFDRDQWSKAEQAYRQALAINEDLARRFPTVAKYHHNLATRLNRLGAALRHTGHPTESEKAYREALAIWEKLAEESPSHPEYRECVPMTLANLGALLAHVGRDSEAEKAMRRALPLVEKLVEDIPLNADYQSLLGQTQNNLAWFLATVPDVAMRRPKQAVELAKKAAALAPQDGGYQNTLGVAHYRAGNWQDAIAAIEQGMKLTKAGGSCDWFFLAMARWQLGERAEAQTSYVRAVDWMEKNRPQDDELRRFRAEAAELLGIKE